MPAFYEYKCVQCGQHHETTKVRADRLECGCITCGDWGPLVRVFSFSMERPLQEHWNSSLQMPIRDNKQYDRELRRKSIESSEYSGVEQRFERIDPGDYQALGVTAEGLDHTNRQRVAQGHKPINLDNLA